VNRRDREALDRHITGNWGEDSVREECAHCRHCGRPIVQDKGAWVDPEAMGDDSVWREVCDAHDTFTAEHEPDVQS
jgi:hypothetical protein